MCFQIDLICIFSLFCIHNYINCPNIIEYIVVHKILETFTDLWLSKFLLIWEKY